MTYEEKLNRLTEEDFFAFFSLMHAEPRWVNSAGKHSIQLLGICHNGQSHSAVFDPTTTKVTCFSECNGGMLLHTWIKRVLKIENPQEAKDFFEDWMDGQNIDFEKRISHGIDEFIYQERPFEVEDIPPLPSIGDTAKVELYSKFQYDDRTLSRLVWHTKDGIDVEWLKKFEVAYYPKRKTIILPHHNINGEIVGLYERSFLPLRKEMKDQFPEADYKWLCQFPRAKYVPLLKEGHFADEDEKKTSWSFSNVQNLYGLHLAKDEIKRTGKAIVFEGAKSVMLAHQFGFHYAVASHTFGINVKQISMLINAGAKEIILAFDKQYQDIDLDDKQWKLYEKKTAEMAEKICKFVDVSRIVDYFENEGNPLLGYKDAPIDRGRETFQKLFLRREILAQDGKMIEQRKRLEIKSKTTEILSAISRKKINHEEPIDPNNLNNNGMKEV